MFAIKRTLVSYQKGAKSLNFLRKSAKNIAKSIEFMINPCYTVVGYYDYSEVLMAKQIRYNRLWKILVDQKLSKADLRKAIGAAPNTLTKLRRDEEVSMSVLIRICEYLDCDIGDIVSLEDVKERPPDGE